MKRGASASTHVRSYVVVPEPQTKLKVDIEISDPQNTFPNPEDHVPEILAPLSAAEAESEVLKKRLAAAEKRGQGLRAAYECAVEALINTTIKIANAEAEGDHLSSQLADTEAKLRLTEKERDTLSSQLTNTRLQLEAVLHSSSWRITQPVTPSHQNFGRPKAVTAARSE